MLVLFYKTGKNIRVKCTVLYKFNDIVTVPEKLPYKLKHIVL